MKKTLFLLIFVASSLWLNAQTEGVCYNVVPQPQSVELVNGVFVLDNNTRVAYPEGNEEMERNARFLQEYIEKNTGIRVVLSTNTSKPAAGTIVLALDEKIAEAEGYEMTISPKVSYIKGQTPAGVFYGIQTLRKSLPVAKLQNVELPAAKIKDAPRFGYRGMMLDCCRHFFPLDFVKEYIDLIAMHNMNRFHWHLSEDQGWRIEIKKYPMLTQVASKRPRTIIGHNSQLYDNVPVEGYYTQDECREIVEYARQRYVEVIPEIDMPGHQRAALAAYPELGCTGGPYKVGEEWGIYVDILCMGNEQTYQFCEDVLSEVMDIFPSKMIHIGGDEAPKDRTEECPKCQAMMAREGLTLDNSQGYFTNRIEKFVNSRGRSIVGWDEILEGDINKSATIHGWRGSKHGIKAALAGHDVIMSPTTYCYFDFQQSDPKEYPEPSLCYGLIPVQKIFEAEIIPDSLPAEAKDHFLGIQANLWTEYIKYPSVAEYQVLPRMAALCEQQWCKERGKWDEFLPRVTKLSELYDLYNLNYARHIWPEKMRPEYVDW